MTLYEKVKQSGDCSIHNDYVYIRNIMDISNLKTLLSLDNRDMGIVIGLYLSWFNKQALDAFEFSSFRQAYKTIPTNLTLRPEVSGIHRCKDRQFFDTNQIF